MRFWQMVVHGIGGLWGSMKVILHIYIQIVCFIANGEDNNIVLHFFVEIVVVDEVSTSMIVAKHISK